MKFELMQYRWYRKWKGGTYYLIYNWVTLPFWCDKMITSCGGRAIKNKFNKIMENKITLEVGRTYKSRDGRLIEIIKGNPPINDERIGWNGIYWGSSVDDKQPKLDSERYIFDGRWWSYISQFSMTGYEELSNPSMDLIEIINYPNQ